MKRAAAFSGGGATALALLACGWFGIGEATTPAGEWRAFTGTWSVTGERQVVATDSGNATIAHVTGAVAISMTEGLPRGFQGEAITFDDGRETSIGRCVWTDQHGDHLFSSLRGEALQAGKQVTGTITGGTGRYAGLEGEYTFVWQFVLPNLEGEIQGRAVRLSGRIRQAGEP